MDDLGITLVKNKQGKTLEDLSKWNSANSKGGWTTKPPKPESTTPLNIYPLKHSKEFLLI